MASASPAAERPARKVRIGINGFGRIGRLVLRVSMAIPELEVVCLNASRTLEYLVYQFKYDSTHGCVEKCYHDGEYFYVRGRSYAKLPAQTLKIKTYSFRDPSKIPWGDHEVDYVVEATGAFRTIETAQKHLTSADRPRGARKVLISAPSKDAPMFVYGVNHNDYDSSINVFSCASCTTNALAPVIKVLHENFGVSKGFVTTIHAMTSSQNLLDNGVKGGDWRKWRSGRGAQQNIIPAPTGAAKAVGKVYPVVDGKITGMAMRVPIPNGSVIDLTVETEKKCTYEQVKAAFKLASQEEMAGVLGYTEDPVVSSDIIGDSRSTIFDATAGMELPSQPGFFKLISWYDNEYGYSSRMCDLLLNAAKVDGLLPRAERVPALKKVETNCRLEHPTPAIDSAPLEGCNAAGNATKSWQGGELGVPTRDDLENGLVSSLK